MHQRKRKHNNTFKNKSILKKQKISTRLWHGDNNLFKVTVLRFHHDSEKALESVNSFEHILDLDHQLGLGFANGAVGAFLNRTPRIAINGIITREIRWQEIGAVEVALILWWPLLTLSRGMARSMILIPCTWPFNNNSFQPRFDHSLHQLYIAVWIEPVDIPEDHYSLGELGFHDTWNTTKIVSKQPVVLGVVQ